MIFTAVAADGLAEPASATIAACAGIPAGVTGCAGDSVDGRID